MPKIISLQLASGTVRTCFLPILSPQPCAFLYTNVPECYMNDVSANFTFCIIKLCVFLRDPFCKSFAECVQHLIATNVVDISFDVST